MLLLQIIVLSFVLIFFRYFFWPGSKQWLLFILSLIAIYWFQTPSAIRHLSFWMPTILLIIAVLSWRIVFSHKKVISKDDFLSLLLIFGLPIVINLLKAIGIINIGFITDSPQLIALIIFTCINALIFTISAKVEFVRKYFPGFVTLTLILLMILIKNQIIAKQMSFIIRQVNGQSTTLASQFDISWVGFSYFSFRLIHLLADRERIKRTGASLRDFITFLFFFPAFTAGPIDRFERFSGELNKTEEQDKNSDLSEGIFRIFVGLFQKFIVADNLALISMNSYSGNMITNSVWLWVSLYAYTFRIFFDFSGYTEIAIGIARISGIKLPENFNRPYRSKNITIFWNNWHITLTQWFRTYYFNPLVRFFRSKYKNLSPVLVLFFAQISTMVLIGLWHGVSWNFVIWGLWNGLGLFIHNRWSEKFKPKLTFLSQKCMHMPYSILSLIFTFHFVALGWIWFALPTINESISIFTKLF